MDAATRIVGFFVSAMGVGLIFHGTGRWSFCSRMGCYSTVSAP
ncbi:hypothetical protein [Pseudomonas koreensis]